MSSRKPKRKVPSLMERKMRLIRRPTVTPSTTTKTRAGSEQTKMTLALSPFSDDNMPTHRSKIHCRQSVAMQLLQEFERVTSRIVGLSEPNTYRKWSKPLLAETRDFENARVQKPMQTSARRIGGLSKTNLQNNDSRVTSTTRLATTCSIDRASKTKG